MESEKKSFVKFYIYLFITLLIMGIIFFFSSQPSGESEASSDLLVDFLEKLFGRSFSADVYEIIVFLVRKGAHFSEYLLLGLFFSLMIKERRTFLGKELVLSTIVCSLYALSDEIHQQFVSGRSGELRDVCIDASGVFLGCFLVWIFSRKKRELAGIQQG